MKREICIYRDKEELIVATTEKIINTINQATQKKGICNVALAGGNTPRGVYSMLATDTYKDRVDWNCVHFFWGDERTVPPDHTDSNYGMVQKSLLSHITIAEENIHRTRGEIGPDQSAAEYLVLLRDHFKEEIPHFDLIILGLGEDGHTASLFPGTGALEVNDVPAIAVFVTKLNTWRITLTMSVLNNAGEIIFLVSGKSKSKVVKEIIDAVQPTKDLPATLVRPENGTINWMLDSEAAALIDDKITV